MWATLRGVSLGGARFRRFTKKRNEKRNKKYDGGSSAGVTTRRDDHVALTLHSPITSAERAQAVVTRRVTTTVEVHTRRCASAKLMRRKPYHPITAHTVLNPTNHNARSARRATRLASRSRTRHKKTEKKKTRKDSRYIVCIAPNSLASLVLYQPRARTRRLPPPATKAEIVPW